MYNYNANYELSAWQPSVEARIPKEDAIEKNFIIEPVLNRRRKLKRNLVIVFLVIFAMVVVAVAVLVSIKDELIDKIGEDESSGQSSSAPTASFPITPTTSSPPISSPTTSGPTTSTPTISSPTTSAPTTSSPTTSAPITSSPTTSSPTTSTPTTSSPTTSASTTSAPTTSVPTSLSPTTSPIGAIEVFPKETRNGDNYIGLFFLAAPNEVTEQVFQAAADRWSEILAGSENLMEQETFTAGTEICPGDGNVLSEDIVVDHLRITVEVVPIDGEFSVVGRAGFCRIKNNIPTFGLMEFDSADIDRMARIGTLESVILHEMGHVLGIGTIWNHFSLLQNRLANDLPDADAVQPTYTGLNGVEEYKLLTGLTDRDFINVENGFTNGNSNGAAQGSVNSHWDQDDMGIELMTFIIQALKPPLSAVTYRRLV